MIEANVALFPGALKSSKSCRSNRNSVFRILDFFKILFIDCVKLFVHLVLENVFGLHRCKRSGPHVERDCRKLVSTIRELFQEIF